jgi:hypothetical protein
MVEQMSLASTAYDKGVNEFIKAGFTEVKSEKVRPPRVAEAPVSFECTVTEVIELADTPGAGNLVLAKVELMHINENYLDENGQLDTKKLDLVGRMGGSWYTRSSGDSLFEIPKPIRNKGIGVDSLPASVRNSAILTGNNLGRLGNLEKLPTSEEIKSVQSIAEVQTLLKDFGAPNSEKAKKIHQLAKRWLEEGRVADALALLLN